MKKGPLAAVIVGFLVVVGIGGYVVMNSKDDNKSETSSDTSASSSDLQALDACTLFTLEDAKTILGASASKGTEAAPTSSEDTRVSTCSYTNNASVVAEIKTATVLVRSPLTEAGITSNQEVFGAAKPQGAQDVAGYGEAAYWDPATGQLSVLKDESWIIINSGAAAPAQRTMDEAKKTADVVVK